ncbi:polar amino acid transport system substrate-binding protein [Azospirillaceae bacterium]
MRFSSCRFLGAVLAAVVVSSAGASHAACSLQLGWELYEPFQMKNSDGKIGGIDVDLFSEAAKQAGCAVTLKEVPWKRLLIDIEGGKMDAAMGASITAERQAFGHFSESYRKDEFVLFVRKGEASKVEATGIASLVGKPFRLGIVGGYEYGESFDALKKPLGKQVDEAASTELNLRKLASSRIDGLLENNFVGLALARKENLSDKIEIHPTPISSDVVSFMFSKKSVDPAVVTGINDALKAMRADGRYDQILARYLK